ncbi:saccharopine dehydrogenase-like NADP-dependent oxidoreductase [Rhizobium petrolearium]|uniref:saccharopine dehydrogenase family protein n=1 Tax=Neorhizobium petrolearium TaxID=515361 RepID=UPI001AEA2741|nr:saccharopine dehydrogenase C-terminal domain-containing protein [Neorhizobium petrolearium]MBP1843332.1 saccharopine dehydrogenase-like NADP-dependent oxidoreductase [Neorhizobium petrolearium]
MTVFKVTIFGAGKIGSALAIALSAREEFSVLVIDPSEQALDGLRDRHLSVKSHLFRRWDELPALLRERDATVAAVPQRLVPEIAKAAVGAGTHFLDFSPLQPDTRQILEPLARQRVILNGCGVAPGIVENIATGLIADSGPIQDLTIRVGSIPRFPTNRLGYGQIWDVDGLIDEYTKPCEAIRDGRMTTLTPLEDIERIMLDGVAYEGFTTSGGLKDLELFRQMKARNVTFKTLRYPGHLDYMRFLLDDLGLKFRRDMLRSLFLNGLPIIEDDVLLLFLTAKGLSDNRKVERSLSVKFRPNSALGPFNAMTAVASGYAASLLLLLRQGELGTEGFVAHNRVPSQRLLESSFLTPLVGG